MLQQEDYNLKLHFYMPCQCPCPCDEPNHMGKGSINQLSHLLSLRPCFIEEKKESFEIVEGFVLVNAHNKAVR